MTFLPPEQSFPRSVSLSALMRIDTSLRNTQMEGEPGLGWQRSSMFQSTPGPSAAWTALHSPAHIRSLYAKSFT